MGVLRFGDQLSAEGNLRGKQTLEILHTKEVEGGKGKGTVRVEAFGG